MDLKPTDAVAFDITHWTPVDRQVIFRYSESRPKVMGEIVGTHIYPNTGFKADILLKDARTGLFCMESIPLGLKLKNYVFVSEPPEIEQLRMLISGETPKEKLVKEMAKSIKEQQNATSNGSGSNMDKSRVGEAAEAATAKHDSAPNGRKADSGKTAIKVAGLPKDSGRENGEGSKESFL